MLLSIMVNINSFYHIKVLELRYFFFTKTAMKKSKKLYCVTRSKWGKMQNQIKKTTKKQLKINLYPNYATVMIEFCLFVSLKWRGLVCFWNEQLKLADWNYTLKETRFNNCFNRENFNIYLKFLWCSCTL